MTSSTRAIQTFVVERPWGQFRQFTKNENTTVKIHHIKPHSLLSLQYHKHRSELWYIISGHPVVTIGETKLAAKPGDEFLDHELQKHRIEAVDEPVVILEICYGEFNEEDIVRIEDTYGRT